MSKADMKSFLSTFFFDFDYTLADSSHGAVKCINFALTQLGFPAVAEEEACKTIGLSLPDTLAQLAGNCSDSQERQFIKLFTQRADQIMADSTTFFESVPETISMLKQQGFKLGIVSTKFRYRIEAILNRENLLHVFDVIVGGEDVLKHKPDPEGLLRAIDITKSSFGDTIYVGDSVVDAETAKRARVCFLAMLSGPTAKDAFDGYEVYGFAERFPDILKLKCA